MQCEIPNAYILDITMYKIHVSSVLTIVIILISKNLTVTYKEGYMSVFQMRFCRQRWVLLYILTYLLTSWCRVLLEKLTGLQLVKKFSAFLGTQRFITALTSVRHLSLSWASPIQSIYPHPTSWRSILILSTHLRLGLPSELFPSGLPSKTLYTPLSSPIRAILFYILLLITQMCIYKFKR